MERKFKYMREDFGELKIKQNHLTLSINFKDDRVEVTNILDLTANENLGGIRLNADELNIISVETVKSVDDQSPVPAEYIYDEKFLDIKLKLQKGDNFFIKTKTHCFPSDTVLEGIYKDTTPKGAPQQYISQCEQWGFQRIAPVIDDCRAKCTMTTTIEADARYTHLISNGNIVKETNPDGKPVVKGNRKSITYHNDIPMSPYLFIAAAGTWDELMDSVTYDTGHTIKLEYLVPPGKTEDAKIPMEILKKSILWMKETQDYEYKNEVYRTICMNKSNFGGMENVGNTTIVTDSALVDEHTLDGYMLYTYGVIIHEFEHNQCGSETTMETPFDMWLNEGYTVNVERDFMADQFDPSFIRLGKIESIRQPLLGPLAMEDSGVVGRISREGFDHPDDIVDGLTYVKSAEVIRMLRIILGTKKFKEGKTLYFTRYKDGNANTDQFFKCFEEVSESLEHFKDCWLFTAGYPKIEAKTDYDGKKFRITLTQKQEKPFHLPIEIAVVDKDGNDIESKVHIMESREEEVVFKGEGIAFASMNRDYSFYGTFKSDMTRKELVQQTELDPNHFNRVEAMKQLTDIERIKLMKDPAAKIDEDWLKLYGQVLDAELPRSLKARMLAIGENPLDREYCTWYLEMNFAKDQLMKAVNARYRQKIIELYKSIDTYTDAPLEQGFEDRMLKNVLLGLIAKEDTPQAHDIIINQYMEGTTATDKVSALIALNKSSSPERKGVLKEVYGKWKDDLSGYSNYLRVISYGTNESVFDEIEAEKTKEGFDIKQPTYSRALILPMAFNTKMVWTDEGMDWVVRQVIEFSKINTILASRLLNLFQHVKLLRPNLKGKVTNHIKTIAHKVTKEDNPTINGQANAYLK